MNNKLTIVTAASANHFNCLRNLLYTASLFEPTVDVLAYDIGMTEWQRSDLVDACAFSWRGELRPFDFDAYPPHFKMDRFAGRLAWRPTVVFDVMRERGGTVLWLDAGTRINARLRLIRSIAQADGVYSPTCSPDIGPHLHPSTWGPFGATPEILGKNMRDAGVVAFDSTNPKALALAERWKDVAQDPMLMDPAGATRSTHRQDAVFSVLYHQAGFGDCRPAAGEVSIKKDDVTLRETMFVAGRPYVPNKPRSSAPVRTYPGYADAIRRAAKMVGR